MSSDNAIDLKISAIRAKAEREKSDKADRLKFINDQLVLLSEEITRSKHLADLAITAVLASDSLLSLRNGKKLGEWWTKDNSIQFTEGSRQDVLISATDAKDAGAKFVDHLERRGVLH